MLVSTVSTFLAISGSLSAVLTAELVIRHPRKGHTNIIASVAFSPNSRYAVICSVDNIVHIFDLAYYEKTISLKEIIDKIKSLACTIV